ncbi:GNAT family N-acetyltransferase [Natronoglycomyces albus]|uniref:N-acetyltransferase n=1 Tax=Natronoglycomyces albus TaxID=2811108 RepID=A0A895XT50_9ACTN|nr:GNAT family N-acetyltransferase [Natronoglycomyces albus]QSB05440.1 N-acetyltransferase [Natronoglycomyces albus]
MPTDSTPALRLARPDDLAPVCAMVNHYIATSTVNFRTEPQTTEAWRAEHATLSARYPWMVAEAAGEVVAIAYAKPWNPRPAYDWCAESTVYVDPAHLGKGIGTALYRHLFAVMTSQGFHSTMAVVTLPNPGSIALHRAVGFQPVGTIDNAGYKFGNWHSVALWQRRLASAQNPPPPLKPVAAVAG